MAKRKTVDETEYLLRSPRNAERLLRALKDAKRGEGNAPTLEELRTELGLGPKRPA